ncbi:MFS transporter [Dyadobacter sediminis]|uniref:MFS transporter n=1 Tax=Dyadobacter sediminis TaxID=1493691 RepID=A0A5R9KPW8_9BACT|nr:MFS transporter [Dyadobacter sediminis]TLU98351.1 MFS transporter [Dyadobacter sediminis]
MRKHIAEMKLPMYASFSLSFALMGDAFLYSFLPINASSIHVPIIWIGTILSINRFTRILLNPLILRVFSLVGFRIPIIVAATISVLATAGYGAGFGIAILVLLRILWGISYSVLRVGAITYAMDYPKKGLALGMSQSIIESGPLLALLVGPLLFEVISPSRIFLVIALLSMPGVYFAFKLKERGSLPARPFSFKISFPSVFNRLAFLGAFAVEGMLVVLIGALLMDAHPYWSAVEITAVAAGFLMFRRICSLLISPFAGWSADRYGLPNIYSGSILLICLGLLLATNGWVMSGLILVFTFYNVNAALAAGAASAGKADVTQAVSNNATFRDAGSAFGALTAGFLLAFDHLDLIFTLLSSTLILLNWIYHRRAKALVV